jgi:hypothetical protein
MTKEQFDKAVSDLIHGDCPRRSSTHWSVIATIIYALEMDGINVLSPEEKERDISALVREFLTSLNRRDLKELKIGADQVFETHGGFQTHH